MKVTGRASAQTHGTDVNDRVAKGHSHDGKALLPAGGVSTTNLRVCGSLGSAGAVTMHVKALYTGACAHFAAACIPMFEQIASENPQTLRTSISLNPPIQVCAQLIY